MSRTRLLTMGLAAVVVVAVGWLLRDSLGISLDPGLLRERIDGFGIWAPIVFVALVTFRSLLGIPSQLLLIGAGLAFGTIAGTAYGALGITLSGLLYFGGARWAGRDVVEQRVPPGLRPVFDAAGTRVGAAFLAVGTGYPFGPITAYHALAGLTGMGIVAFVGAVATGSVARALVYTFFGSSLMQGDLRIVGVASVVLAAAFVLPLCFPRSRRWVAGLYRATREGRSAQTRPGTTGSGPR